MEGMQFERSDMSFTLEVTMRLIEQGHAVVEVPIDYIPRGHCDGKKLYWADGFIGLWLLLKYRIGRARRMRETMNEGEA